MVHGLCSDLTQSYKDLPGCLVMHDGGINVVIESARKGRCRMCMASKAWFGFADRNVDL